MKQATNIAPHERAEVDELYTDDPERPTVLHYVPKGGRGRDTVAICGSLMRAGNVIFNDEIKNNRPRVMCPFCEYIMQAACERSGRDYVGDYLHGSLRL